MIYNITGTPTIGVIAFTGSTPVVGIVVSAAHSNPVPAPAIAVAGSSVPCAELPVTNLAI